jgi:hypothetical protein
VPVHNLRFTPDGARVVRPAGDRVCAGGTSGVRSTRVKAQPVIYLVLIGPFVALPALLALERYEQWAVNRRVSRDAD